MGARAHAKMKKGGKKTARGQKKWGGRKPQVTARRISKAHERKKNANICTKTKKQKKKDDKVRQEKLVDMKEGGEAISKRSGVQAPKGMGTIKKLRRERQKNIVSSPKEQNCRGRGIHLFRVARQSGC